MFLYSSKKTKALRLFAQRHMETLNIGEREADKLLAALAGIYFEHSLLFSSTWLEHGILRSQQYFQESKRTIKLMVLSEQ